MKWAVALTVAVTLVAGCKGAASLAPLDPFARTTVTPPGTANVGAPLTDNPLRPVTPQNGEVPAPATGPTSPSFGGQYAPPGGSFQLQGAAAAQPSPTTAAIQPGDRIGIPVDARDLSKQPSALAGDSQPNDWSIAAGGGGARTSTPATMASSRSTVAAGQPATPSTPAMPERFVQTIEPRPGVSAGNQNRLPTTSAATGSGGNPTEAEPGILPSTDGVINIMDLPPAGAFNMEPTRPGASGVVLASATEVVDSFAPAPSARPAGAQLTSGSPLLRYDHATDYARLRGQLEFSAVSRLWKLRYIPIDGRNDDFGGSVLISNPETLSGCERGDFVEVHGRLDATAADNRHFTPEYEISQIRRLAE